MKFTAAAFGSRVDHPACVAELGGVFALLNLKLLERVDRRLDQRPALVMIGDIDSIQVEGRHRALDAANPGAVLVVGADWNRITAGWQRRRARGQGRQLVKAAAVQGKIDNLLIVNVLP